MKRLVYLGALVVYAAGVTAGFQLAAVSLPLGLLGGCLIAWGVNA